jgi:hypothetical protein
MKKKSRPEIPDFARKRPHDQPLDKLNPPKSAKPFGPRTPVIKPQATAAKGNRRGG